MARTLEMPRHRHDARLVGAAFDHHVDLERREACGRGDVDAFQYPIDGKIDVVHRAEGRIVERVEAHSDPLQTGVAQASRFLRQQRAVGGQRQIKVADRGQHLDQPFDVPAQQRFAAGKADFRYALIDEDSCNARYFFERQQLRMRQERVVAAKHILRHAIHAAEVAAIGHRNSEIVKPAAAGVGNRTLRPDRRERSSAQQRPML